MDSGQKSFHANLFDFGPNLVSCRLVFANSVLVNVIENGCQWPFVSNISLGFALVLYESISLLVDCIVSQMHTKIIEITAHGRVVLFSGKTSKALFIDETAKGIQACD